jgi:hypothetical protein
MQFAEQCVSRRQQRGGRLLRGCQRAGPLASEFARAVVSACSKRSDAGLYRGGGAKAVAQRRPDPIYSFSATTTRRCRGWRCGSVQPHRGRVAGLQRRARLRLGPLVTAAAIVEAARILPMMASHRVVTVLRAEAAQAQTRARPRRQPSLRTTTSRQPDADALEAYARPDRRVRPGCDRCRPEPPSLSSAARRRRS